MPVFDPGPSIASKTDQCIGSTVETWQIRQVLFGMTLAFALAGVAAWFLWDWMSLQLERARKQNASAVLEKIDGPALRRLCGNVNLPAWIRYPDFERVQWLNDLVEQLWPNAQAAAAGIVRTRLDPMLKSNKPAWIYDIAIHTFTLGETPPRISAVKVFSTESVIDEVGLEFECIWNGAQRFQLAIRPFPRIPTGLGLGAVLSKILAMRVGVGNIWFKGTVRVAMKPLLDRLPLVGAVKVSLVEPPEFSFSVQLQGGDITFLPGLELWLTSFIKDSLLLPYVLPEGITIPLDPTAGKAEVPRGVLYAKVLEAKHLPWLDWLTLPDPYVQLYARGRRKQRTKICKKSFNPRWDEEFVLLIHDPDQQHLNAKIFDNDLIGADKEIGSVKIPIADLPSGEDIDKWFELEAPEVQSSSNPLQLGMRGVRSVSDAVRDVVHLPFTAAAKGRPQLHLRITYHSVGEAEVEAARHDTHEAQQAADENPIVQLLRGGILLVTVKKGSDPGSRHSGLAANMVTIIVGEQTKGTAATEGSENQDWEETIEFAVGGDVVDRENEQIEVRVWDYHWIDHLGENLSWDLHATQREGVVHIPLKRIIDEGHLDDTFRLENVDGEIDLELRWVAMLDRGSSAE